MSLRASRGGVEPHLARASRRERTPTLRAVATNFMRASTLVLGLLFAMRATSAASAGALANPPGSAPPNPENTEKKSERKPVHWTTTANRFFAPDLVAAPDAFNGVDMKADPEPELKWHRTTWISLAMIATSLALMVSGASGLFLLSLPALAWFPATYALLKSNAERSHSGKGINRILFFSTLAWFVLYLAFILPWWGNWPYFGWQ